MNNNIYLECRLKVINNLEKSIIGIEEKESFIPSILNSPYYFFTENYSGQQVYICNIDALTFKNIINQDFNSVSFDIIKYFSIMQLYNFLLTSTYRPFFNIVVNTYNTQDKNEKFEIFMLCQTGGIMTFDFWFKDTLFKGIEDNHLYYSFNFLKDRNTNYNEVIKDLNNEVSKYIDVKYITTNNIVYFKNIIEIAKL